MALGHCATPANANAYRDVVKGESGLIAYYPSDQARGGVVTNVVNPLLNGALELGAIYDGRTNRALIERALYFNADGQVQIPASPAFDFASGNGTMEALVFLDHATLQNQTLFFGSLGRSDASSKPAGDGQARASSRSRQRSIGSSIPTDRRKIPSPAKAR